MKRLLTLAFLMALVMGCQKFYKPEIKTSISQNGDDESHHYGENCMNCHYSEGWAEGVFTLAGSCEGNITNARFILSHNSNGSNPIMEVEVDALGNAYTTVDIDFSGGLYTGVRVPGGDLEMMDDKIFHGQCNLCHGTPIEEPIEAE